MKDRIQALFKSLVEDFQIAVRSLILNSVAGNCFMPRAGRLVIYRSMGIQALGANIFSGCRFTGTRVSIGSKTFINHECYFDIGKYGVLEIGDSCNFGPQVMVLSMSHDLHPSGKYARSSMAVPVRIGDNVWLGARVVVAPGVSITDGVVVAAGSVVAGDIEIKGLWGGVPARLIREFVSE